MAISDHNLVWVDMEMTGLIPEVDRVIEIATIVTDSHLNVLAEGPVIAIKQPDAALEAMDEWNTRTHSASGLVERVRSSAVSEQMASDMTLDFRGNGCQRACRQCAGIPSVRTGASWRGTCPPSKNTFITAIST